MAGGGARAEVLDCAYVLDALGGARDISRMFQISPTAVAAWRRNGIPANRCLALAEIARRRRLCHFTVEALLRALPSAELEPIIISSGKPEQPGRRLRNGAEAR